ncbi:hypothetical protein ACOMHN_027999 [Nucella lapillus]
MAALAGSEHIRTTSPLYTVHDDAFFSPEPDAVAVAGAGAAPQPPPASPDPAFLPRPALPQCAGLGGNTAITDGNNSRSVASGTN